MGDNKSAMLWIPGNHPRPAAELSRHELPWGIMSRVIEFADLATAHGMGLHCSKCQQDFTGTNSEHDPVLAMHCGCREFWSVQPLARPS